MMRKYNFFQRLDDGGTLNLYMYYTNTCHWDGTILMCDGS